MATTKTNVIGYFNPNDYPLLLSISEFNMQIHLDPKKYIVDRTGALVNDPLLDAYVGKGRLSRASDPKQQVDIVRLRPVNPPPSPGAAPTTFTHSVSQATGFQVRDGRVQPIAPTPTAVQPAAVPPPVSYNPVKSYTIEEAKKLKLIRPTRPVPEDYGAEETTGAPKSGQEIPEIKYAIDSGPRGRRPAPLPVELAQPATPQQAALVQSLNQAAATNPEDPNLFRRAVPVVPALPPVGQPIPGLPKPQLTESVAPARITAPPIPKNPQPTAMAALPVPIEEEAPGLVVEEDLGEALTPVVPPPLVDDGITCPRCSEHPPFKNLGMFKRHIRKFHAEEEEVLLKPFVTPTPA